MQVVIHETTKNLFDQQLREHLESGWKVVPGTYAAQSHSDFGWNPGTQRHDTPIYVTNYFVVLDDGTEA